MFSDGPAVSPSGQGTALWPQDRKEPTGVTRWWRNSDGSWRPYQVQSSGWWEWIDDPATPKPSDDADHNDAGSCFALPKVRSVHPPSGQNVPSSPRSKLSKALSGKARISQATWFVPNILNTF